MPDERGPMSLEDAQTEAGILSRSIRTMDERTSGQPDILAKNPFLKSYGGTAFYELKNQQLDQLKNRNPDLYEALRAQEEALTRLAESLAPFYTKAERPQHYLSQALQQQLAAVAPKEERDWAMKAARSVAEHFIRAIVSSPSMEKARTTSGSERFILAAQAVDQFLSESAMMDELNPHQIGAVMEVALATLNVGRFSTKEQVFNPNISEAIKRQKNYDARIKESRLNPKDAPVVSIPLATERKKLTLDEETEQWLEAYPDNLKEVDTDADPRWSLLKDKMGDQYKLLQEAIQEFQSTPHLSNEQIIARVDRYNRETKKRIGGLHNPLHVRRDDGAALKIYQNGGLAWNLIERS